MFQMHFMIVFEMFCTFWQIFTSILTKKLSWNVLETSHKFNKIWLKLLNPHNFKVKELNEIKVLKKN